MFLVRATRFDMTYPGFRKASTLGSGGPGRTALPYNRFAVNPTGSWGILCRGLAAKTSQS
jgi:hypothetical protein